MNIILLEKVGKLGNLGDQVAVRGGFARNYLIPYGKAVPATKSNIEAFESRRAELLAAADAKRGEAQARADKLNGLTVTLGANAGDEGKLFGSIGTRDIADAITAAGVAVDKSEVRLPNGALREVGEYDIDVQVHSDITAAIKLSVVSA